MANGESVAVFGAILAAGSPLARSDWERQLMIWFAEKDQTLLGQTISFDLDDIAWEKTQWESQKMFILEVVHRAMRRCRWDELDWNFSDTVLESLAAFAGLLEAYVPTPNGPKTDWSGPFKTKRLDLCPKHQVFQNEVGCMLCHDVL